MNRPLGRTMLLPDKPWLWLPPHLLASVTTPQCQVPAEADRVFMRLIRPLLTHATLDILDWAPPYHVACYLQVRLSKPLGKEAHSCLSAKCLKPIIPDRISATPDFGQFMVAYKVSMGSDPNKDLDPKLHSASWINMPPRLVQVQSHL